MSRESGGRVVIIGAGLVGSTFAYSLMINGVASEIVMIDVNQERLMGEVMDLNHGIAFVRPVTVRAGDYSDCRTADVIVITAGVSQKPGESRLDLLGRNAAIFQSIVAEINASGSEAIILVATNPVDIMAHFTYRMSGFPPGRVIGSGTVLDTARFRFLISNHCQVDPSNVHAYIIGEHGDSEVPVWSLANIAGVRFSEYCPVCNCNGNCNHQFPRERIFNEVKAAAYRIIEGKGATYYAIGLALVEIVESILRNEYSVLTVSTLMTGEYGLEDVYLSLPCVLSRKGVGQKILLSLSAEEETALRRSGALLKETSKLIKIN
ncbi:MAG: L-lactate dehydrogenase [Firmicutes bacterium]|nr:L-lactate dehydrogenase [Bacillota bacterium]